MFPPNNDSAAGDSRPSALRRCRRLLPSADTGGFFVAVLEKAARGGGEAEATTADREAVAAAARAGVEGGGAAAAEGGGAAVEGGSAASADGGGKRREKAPNVSKPVYVPLGTELSAEVCRFWGLHGGGFPIERLCTAGFHKRIDSLYVGSSALLALQYNSSLHVASGGLPVFKRMDKDPSGNPWPAAAPWRAAHEAAALLGAHASRRTLRLPAAALREVLTRRALPLTELRALDHAASLERCLLPDGSIEEGGVVIGLASGDGASGGIASIPSDRIWHAGLLTEKDGLMLLAEGDVLRRSEEVLAFYGDLRSGAIS